MKQNTSTTYIKLTYIIFIPCHILWISKKFIDSVLGVITNNFNILRYG